MESQLAGAPLPHLPERLAKNTANPPQLPDDTATGHAAWLDWPWKLHRIDGDRYELYDLGSDPDEALDRSGDPGQRERIARMQDELHAWMRGVVRSLRGED